MMRLTNNKDNIEHERENKSGQTAEKEIQIKIRANHCHKANDDDSVWNDQKKKK